MKKAIQFNSGGVYSNPAFQRFNAVIQITAMDTHQSEHTSVINRKNCHITAPLHGKTTGFVDCSEITVRKRFHKCNCAKTFQLSRTGVFIKKNAAIRQRYKQYSIVL